jgi:CelD/BcsL family acetyltransferase involved in cellulose biosynthesis
MARALRARPNGCPLTGPHDGVASAGRGVASAGRDAPKMRSAVSLIDMCARRCHHSNLIRSLDVTQVTSDEDSIVVLHPLN